MFIVAVDYDGTLYEESSLEETGVPRNDVVAKVRDCMDSENCEIILWTCRTGEYLAEAVNNCKELGIFFDAVNNHSPSTIKRIKSGDLSGNSRKIHADIYVDDKAPGSIDLFLQIDINETARNFENR